MSKSLTSLLIGAMLFVTVSALAIGNALAAPSPEAPAHGAVSLEATATPRPRGTAAPARRPKAGPTAQPVFYNLPYTILKTATGLYASPNRSELIVPVPIPAGEKLYVMGRNGTNSHLRVVWNTGVGWVPVSFTDYNGKQDKLTPLPVFEREPPACAEPLTTQFGLNSEWTSDQRQKIAVIADLFRSRYGSFPASYLALKVNGKLVESSRRSIVEQGQFSLKDVVFTVPQDLQPGDTVGYSLDTSSTEPLTFMATIFSVPRNCQWDID